MKKKLFLSSLGLLLAGGALISLGSCSNEEASPSLPSQSEIKPTPSQTQNPSTSQAPANDNIDWTKLETVTPGYGNIGNYKQIQLSITSEKTGLKIGGFLNVPASFDASKQYPLVIMSHGIAGSVTTYDQNYVAYMLEKNVLCFTYFFCGGGSPTTKPDSTSKKATKMMTISEGKDEDMSIITEKEDLISVFNELSKKSFVKKNQIVLMGESMGGAVTSLAAVELQDKIAGEILCYPAMNVYDGAIDGYVRYDKIPEKLYRNGLTLTRDKFYKDIKDLDFYSEAAKFSKKVCLLHGTADGTVDISSSNKLNSMLNDSMYKVVEGGAHGFVDDKLKQAIPHIMSYLKAIGIITNDQIKVGDKSGSFVTNHEQTEPEQTQAPVAASKLQTAEDAVELYRATSKTSSWLGTPDLIFYSDGTIGTTGKMKKKGEWRYIDGCLTVGIEGNGIKKSTCNDDYTKLLITLGWLGGQFKYEFEEKDFINALAGNHGKVDRFDWIGQY